PGHLGLQRVRRADRWFVAVQAVDQAMGGHHPAGLQQQHGQQRARPEPADGDHVPAGRPDLHRTEDAEPHRSILPAFADSARRCYAVTVKTYGRSRSTTASPEQVWKVWSDSNNWNTWNTGIRKAELDGPL